MPESSQNTFDTLEKTLTVIDELERQGYSLERGPNADSKKEVGDYIKNMTTPYFDAGRSVAPTTVDQNMSPLEDIRIDNIFYEDESGNINYETCILALDTRGWGVALGDVPEKWCSAAEYAEQPIQTMVDQNGKQAIYTYSERDPNEQSVNFRIPGILNESDYKIVSKPKKDRITEKLDQIEEEWMKSYFEADNLVLKTKLSGTENDREVRERLTTAQYIIGKLQ